MPPPAFNGGPDRDKVLGLEPPEAVEGTMLKGKEAPPCGWCAPSCEDSADEVVQQLSQEALGRTLSCAGLKNIVGACHRAIVMKHCPASCGLCEDREYLERHMGLANMYGEMNHRQLKKTC